MFLHTVSAGKIQLSE